MTLADQGWRFVHDPQRGWVWKHPADLVSGDVDATDMEDAEFARTVFRLTPSDKGVG